MACYEHDLSLKCFLYHFNITVIFGNMIFKITVILPRTVTARNSCFNDLLTVSSYLCIKIPVNQLNAVISTCPVGILFTNVHST